MYIHHFQLDGTPFSIAPDPRYLYMSAQHREALAHLLYGADAGGGFVLLTGEVGAGKTTVCRCFLQQVAPHCRVAYIFNPRLSPVELLQAICQEFAIPLPAKAPGQTRELVDALNQHLLASHARGEHSLLIIDEAQNLSADVLEQLRLLTNLETNEKKLLQIILIGQPELRQLLQQPQLEQLAQRIIARYHLGPLSEQDSRAYIVHRLAVAGARSAPLFTEGAMRAVHRAARGVPRKINLLCDRALLAAYARNQERVDQALVRHAAAEIFAQTARPRLRARTAALALVLAGVLAAGGWMLQRQSVPSMLAASTSLGTPSAKAGQAGGRPVAGQVLAGAPGPDAAGANAGSAGAAGSAESGGPGPAPVARAGAKAAEGAARAPSAGQAVRLLEAAELATVAAPEAQLLPKLAQAWSADAPSAGASCESFAAGGLFCLRLRGGLSQAREIDRPFLIRLKGEPVRWLLVRELDATNAKVEADGRSAELRLAALEAASAGEILSLWHMQPGFRTQLLAGMRGPDVDWVAAQLGRWLGTPHPSVAAVMDASLVNQVRQFQQLQGLYADGVVGPRTWMKLNLVAGVAEPRLQALPPLASR